jgi:hypothetical protein
VVFEDNPNKHRAISLPNSVISGKKPITGVTVTLKEDHKDDNSHHHHGSGTVHHESMAKVF